MDLAALLPVVLIAAAVIALALGGMAVGVMLSGKRIEGSCGGLANSAIPGHDAESPCMACGESPTTCEKPGAEKVRAMMRDADADEPAPRPTAGAAV